LAYANHYLVHYKAYLLDELQQSDPDIQHFALKRLQQIVYPDSDVMDMIQSFTMSDNILLQQEAARTLEIYRHHT
jgi:hypothetical protein